MNKLGFKANPIVGLCIYFAGFFIMGSIILAVIAAIYAGSSGYTSTEILNAISNATENQALNKIAIGANVFSNTIIYVLIALALSVVLFDYLYEDFIKIKQNPLKFVLTAIVAAILFYGFAFLLDYTVSKLVSTSSDNQQIIEASFSYKGYAVIMFIVTVFLGPLVEELVFRKCIFKLLSKLHYIIPVLVSAVLFALPHMLSTQASFKDWSLMLLPYLGSGIALGFIYKFSDKNIYVTIFVHIINNLISVLLILL